MSILYGARADFMAGFEAFSARWAETHCLGLCEATRASRQKTPSQISDGSKSQGVHI